MQEVRVAVFAEGPEAQEAITAGADVVGADDLVDRIKESMCYLVFMNQFWHVLQVYLYVELQKIRDNDKNHLGITTDKAVAPNILK